MELYKLNPRHSILSLLLFTLVFSSVISVNAASREEKKTVLALHSYHKGLSWTDSITEGIENRFAGSGVEVEFIHEYMDTKRFFTPKHLLDIEEFFLKKYSKRKFDAIISSDDNAFQFLLSNGDRLFPDVPVVFCGVNKFSQTMIEGKENITGVQEDFDFAATIEVALALQGGIKKVVAVLDNTTSGRANRDKLLAAIPKLADRVSFEILDNLTMEEVQRYVAGLESDSIVLWLHFTADRDGNFFSFEESSEMISEASSVPLYSSWDFHMNHGIVGGMITSGFSQGYAAADLVLKVMGGQSPAEVSVVDKSPNRYMFDYLQMQRFGIKMSRLPNNSIVINRPDDFFANHRELILSIIGGFIILTAIIFLLTVSNVKIQKAEQAATAAKNRYLGIFNDTSVALLVEDFSELEAELLRIKTDVDAPYEKYLMENSDLLSSLARKIRIRDVNPAALEMYGAKNKDELSGNLLHLLVSGAENQFQDLVAAMLSQERKYVVETVNKTLSGEEINIILEVKIPHSFDELDAVLVSVVDITEMKRAERARLVSEERFRAAFNSAATGMAILSVDGRYQRVNKVLCDTLGYEESELLSKGWMDVTHPDDLSESRRCLEKLLEGRACEPLEKRYLSKTGEEIWALFSGSIIYDNQGRPMNLISQFQDITPRKKAEARLVEQKERYQKFFEDDLSGVFVVSHNGTFVTCNQSFRTIFGISESGDLEGINFWQFFRKEDDSQQFFNTVLFKKKLVHYELMMNRLDGEHLDVVINAIGRFTQSGKLKELQGYVMNVTQQRALETQLLQAQKLESIGTMAGGVAHDFNNLLMGVLGNTSLLLLDKDEKNPDYKRLKNIEEHVKSGSSLTRQLLGFAKGGKYEVKTFGINEILRINSEMFRQTRKEVEIELKLSDEEIYVDVDKSQIDQVMYNLYVNAWQAMIDGGRISISTEIVEFSQADAAPYNVNPGRYVKVEVEDDGQGMDDSTLKRIFDPFFTTKEISRGIGLGLASSYGIVKNHSGIIEAKSNPGLGTSFYVFLPVSEKKDLAAAVNDGLPTVKRGRGRILIVDDEEMIVEVGAQMLSALGYSVEKAMDGEHAVELFKKIHEGLDLVILDMIMPGMGGGETFDAMKEIDDDVKVILSSGYSLDQKANAILRRGCLGFMQKPFDLQTLSEKIRQVLES